MGRVGGGLHLSLGMLWEELELCLSLVSCPQQAQDLVGFVAGLGG